MASLRGVVLALFLIIGAIGWLWLGILAIIIIAVIVTHGHVNIT